MCVNVGVHLWARVRTHVHVRVCTHIRGAPGAREAQTVGGGPAAPSAHGPEWYTSEQDLSRTEGLWAWPAESRSSTERLTRGEA